MLGLGQIANTRGRTEEAIGYFQRAVKIMPGETGAYALLGSVYFPRGDYARAAEYFQQAVRVNPMDMRARFYLGTCWMKLGKPAQAAEQFHAAREVDPDNFQAYRRRLQRWTLRATEPAPLASAAKNLLIKFLRGGQAVSRR